MKDYQDLSKNQKRAIRVMLDDPEAKCIADVAEKTGLHFNTILKYVSNPDFLRILQSAKRAMDSIGAGPDA